jgi:hypothetical protein
MRRAFVRRWAECRALGFGAVLLPAVRLACLGDMPLTLPADRLIQAIRRAAGRIIGGVDWVSPAVGSYRGLEGPALPHAAMQREGLEHAGVFEILDRDAVTSLGAFRQDEGGTDGLGEAGNAIDHGGEDLDNIEVAQRDGGGIDRAHMVAPANWKTCPLNIRLWRAV